MSMDPGLWSLVEAGSSDDEVGVIVRLVPGGEPPPGIRVVSRFGDILTARMRRGDVVATRRHPAVFSLKAGSAVTLPPPIEDAESQGDAIAEDPDGPSMPGDGAVSAESGDGRGVVVGICDWGFDFTHANFRNHDGTTRLLCLWDQRGHGDPLAPAPYDQGRLLTREAINAALLSPDPCAALGYHPASGDPSNSGAHGTHVADILAGNRREPGSKVGLASGADLVFVHLAAQSLGELGNLGDSIGLLEGLDFVRRQAAGRPCVLHLSAGKTGGPHRGNTLLERAVDTMLKEPGIVLVQSVGNYADAAMHTHARIGPDQRYVLNWLTPRNDRTPNEIEVWYSGEDVFEVTLVAPNGSQFSVELDSRLQLRDGEQVWGNFYHRLREPNSGLNHIVVYLYAAAPSGRWQVVLRGREVVDGRVHAWIERDASGRYQSRFPRSQASSRFTTNTICNCFRAIAVGAYDGHQPNRPPTRFSSRGPTADGRQKPELAAPGYRIRAARSMPRNGWHGEPRLCVKSGTSMAAPWVSGTVALMLASAGRPLTIHEIRRALIGSADPHAGPAGQSSTRLGYGYLNTVAAVTLARQIGQQPALPAPARLPEGGDMTEAEWLPEASEATGAWASEADEAASDLAPVWDSAAALDSDDEVVATPDEAIAANSAPRAASGGSCSCGCGGHAKLRPASAEDDRSEDWRDDVETETSAEETLEIETASPLVWEDVREALDALEVEDVTTRDDP